MMPYKTFGNINKIFSSRLADFIHSGGGEFDWICQKRKIYDKSFFRQCIMKFKKVSKNDSSNVKAHVKQQDKNFL